MRGCYQSTVVADDDVNLQPWFDVAQRTTTAHVPLQPLDFSLVKEQPIRSITAHLGAKAFEKFNHEGGGIARCRRRVSAWKVWFIAQPLCSNQSQVPQLFEGGSQQR